MCMHETKKCQRCNAAFECKPGNITQCQCFEVQLSEEQRAYLEEKYGDCLCRKCLEQVKEEFELFKEKFIYK
ncbi:MAG: cysteine-rich CWC family protein [Chitinophagaceae bacterium]|nr:cysteine-rich CWC family protein [Chitinophagaceae bacterium]